MHSLFSAALWVCSASFQNFSVHPKSKTSSIARVVPFQKVTTDKLTAGIEALLRDGAAVIKAAVVAEQLRHVDGAGVAAEWLARKAEEA